MNECGCNRCKCPNPACRNAWGRENYRNKNKKVRIVENKQRWRKQHPELLAAQTREQRAKSPEKYKARTAVGNALRDGKLTRGECERNGEGCRGNIQAHHDDYSKPLEVRWLCKAHHDEVHTEITI